MNKFQGKKGIKTATNILYIEQPKRLDVAVQDREAAMGDQSRVQWLFRKARLAVELDDEYLDALKTNTLVR